MKKKDNVVVGLDIGTTKVSCIVGEVHDQGVEVLGLGTHPSKGLKKGVIVNLDATVQAIDKAVEEAEAMSGCEVTEVIASISGGHIKGFNSNGVVAIRGRDVTKADLARVVDAASAVAIPSDKEVIHSLVQEYIVDDQEDIKDPLGIAGVRLEAKVHIVTASSSSAHNIIRCANNCGLTVKDMILGPLASADAVLTQDEKELGVAVIDIGGGTTELLIYVAGSVVFSSVVTVGGNNITNDISVGLRTPTVEADRIKQIFGCASSAIVSKDETLEIPSVGGRSPRTISRKVLADIIEPRVEELLSLVYQEISQSGYEDAINSGLVLTGGSSQLKGLPELAENIFGCPVRCGSPQKLGGFHELVSSPMYSTVVGLLSSQAPYYQASGRPILGKGTDTSKDRLYLKMKSQMSNFIKEFF